MEQCGGSGLERLKALIRDYAIIMIRAFGIRVTRTADHELSPETRARFRALKREIDEIVRRVVADGMCEGSIEKGDVRLTTFALAGALNWIARWYDHAGPLQPGETAEGMGATLVHGVASRGSAGASL